MKIINTEKEDYHVHSFTYSDGLATINEIAQYAGQIGMKKVVITDHSQATLDYLGLVKKVPKTIRTRWQNVYNDVEVTFGVEADLLNEDGDVCFDIAGDERDFVILSFHKNIFKGDMSKATEGFIKAIQRFHERINMIGHVCQQPRLIDSKKVIEEANKHKIPLELNARYFLKEPEDWKDFFENAEQIYVNSDSHTLVEFRDLRKKAYELLKEMGYLK
ncbi:PHP domain-containing protein [Candidatus Woesearchaeota archaeon]|nr:PHP domain-containing protein [Candidatus Woesearchaeota archaeon]